MTDYDPYRPAGSGLEPVDPGPYWNPPVDTRSPADPYYPPGQHSPADQYYPTSQQSPAGQYYPTGQYSPTGQYGPSASYSTPGYDLYPGSYPGWTSAPTRPGQVTAIAVLSYFEAGVLILSTLLLFIGAIALADVGHVANHGAEEVLGQMMVCGLTNVAATALFIIGGVTLTSRMRGARFVVWAATIIVALQALYWIVNYRELALVIWAVSYVIMPFVAVGLARTQTVTAWLGARPPAAQ